MTSQCNLQTTQEIEQHAGQIVNEFVQCITPDKRPLVDLFFYETSPPHRIGQAGSYGRPIRATTKNNVLELLVCTEDLLDIPFVALEGWLELEVARSVVESAADSCRFNFQNQILPLMRLAGGSLYYVRELVEYLSQSLKRREATKMVNQMGRGLPQVYYYFHTTIPTAEEREFYTKFASYSWMRASHLCGKLVEYMGLSYLADHGIGFSQNLSSDWKKQHGYLPDDQAFLDKMVLIANQFADQTFSFQMVEMFKLLRDTLLLNNSYTDIPP